MSDETVPPIDSKTGAVDDAVSKIFPILLTEGLDPQSREAIMLGLVKIIERRTNDITPRQSRQIQDVILDNYNT